MSALAVPSDAPAPVDGAEWRHATLLCEGDLAYVGEGNIFGEREALWYRVSVIEETPKTYTLTLNPTHPRLLGFVQAPVRKDDWLMVKRGLILKRDG